MSATTAAKPIETASRSFRRDRERKPAAAPAVRARAAALGIDLSNVDGTGKEGRILHEDLDALLLRRSSALARPAMSSPREGIQEIKVIGLRRQIAQAMQDAKRRIPHFSYVEEVDVTALEALRRDLNDDRASGRPRLTVLPFLIRALVGALPDHPGINAHFDDEAGIIRRYAAIHIGVATQTRRGLVVPVIRHVETLDLVAIGVEIDRLSEAARAGKASREELSGSLTIVDRAKDVIKTGGETVYSTEVENALHAHPAVLEAAVFGVPDPDLGERIVAAVVLRVGARASGEELRSSCRSRIAGFKVPREVRFAGDLPRTGSGKVSKRILREMG
jgi:pyruvate/2-oxoglutarate dehydrogenase complex dihydrolipoamide acyltransferase (E2) component